MRVVFDGGQRTVTAICISALLLRLGGRTLRILPGSALYSFSLFPPDRQQLGFMLSPVEIRITVMRLSQPFLFRYALALDDRLQTAKAQVMSRMEKILKGASLRIRPEWQDPGDDKFEWIALEDEDGGRIRIAPLGTGLSVTPNQIVTTDMVEVV